ncbi:hypothetical protein EMGBD1_10540, partial [Anaerolineaceae bacterium]
MCASRNNLRGAARAGCGLLLALVSVARPALCSATAARGGSRIFVHPFRSAPELAGLPERRPGATAARLQGYQLPWELPLLPAEYPEKIDLPSTVPMRGLRPTRPYSISRSRPPAAY